MSFFRKAMFSVEVQSYCFDVRETTCNCPLGDHSVSSDTLAPALALRITTSLSLQSCGRRVLFSAASAREKVFLEVAARMFVSFADCTEPAVT